MRIVVLAGGLSAERDVSLSTGAMVGKALRENGHQAVVIDLFLGIEHPIDDMDAFFASGNGIHSASVESAAPDLAAVKALRKDDSDAHIGPQVLALCQAADIVFMALHGADGEDGKLQATFDLLGIKYTGSGSFASALAMNKDVAKLIFEKHGLQTPRGVTIAPGQEIPALSLPVVVKPCCGGSSVATTYVETLADMKEALAAVFALGDIAVVEEFILGRELSVGVLDDIALPVVELVYDGPLFNYFTKYQANACQEICPAPIADSLKEQLQKLAVAAHRALGLEVYSRLDFIVRADGEIYLLEANTLPGMTAASIVPKMAAEFGLSYTALCEKIIDLSWQRYQE